jgi:hypothetical protein
LNEVFAFLYLRGDLRQLPSDIEILFEASQTMYIEVRYGLLYLFVRLLFLRMLGALSGRLHATAALMVFWGVLLMKILKLDLDSPLLSVSLPH